MPKANGFLLFGLFAADGTRQNSAPDFIGYNHATGNNDGRIHVNFGCYGCHYTGGGKAGFRDIDGWIRGLISPKFPLQSPDKDALKVLRQQYLRDIQEPMDDDRRTHTRAVLKATGWEPEKFGQEYIQTFVRYESRVDAARAAADLGLDKTKFLVKLELYRATFGSINFQLAGLAAGKTIGIRQWEKEIPRAQLVIRGIQQP